MSTCDNCGSENVKTQSVVTGSRYDRETWGWVNVKQNLCSSCYFVCNDCHKSCPIDDQITVGDMKLCEDCSTNYCSCIHCHEIIRYDDSQYDGDDVYCQSCMEKYVPIKDSCYKPNPIFHGDGTRFFGVELEIDGGSRGNAIAKRIISSISSEDHSNFIYAKTDGSIPKGMEIVSHPATLDAHMNVLDWKNLLKTTQSYGYYDCGYNCGLHIHVSRTSFGKDSRTQKRRIGRFVYFFEKFFPEIVSISRRHEMDQVNSWASSYWESTVNFSYARDILDRAWKQAEWGYRYHAVNLCNEHTIEVRIFNSTLNYEEFIGTLQFCNLVTEIANNYTLRQIDSMTWGNVLNIARKSGMTMVDALAMVEVV